ncbi:probable inactive poly [ADP-ribose] polymerase SRO3 [Durio zibethinus]|uniref:Probable inactive poly [ADP-ribose] polymerase SRO3 n=1 Tax=Durio zibethinus TaxID=66656 RepID=A0A6P6B5K0_DURZI|nr:probable inactive poly [ADP-ribose] polymerase SRO3 [Durio zibethinus]
MAQQGATKAASTKSPEGSVRITVPPLPSSSSSTKNQEKCIVGGCGVQSSTLKRVFNQNNANFGRSTVPSRLMYYRNGSWMNFSADVVETLKTCFVERKPIIEASVDGAKYIFDFKKMIQTDYLTGNCRSISWIDENDECFFPKEVFSEEDFMEFENENEKDDNIICNYKTKNNICYPKIEIEVKIDPSSSKRKRQEEAEVSSTKHPLLEEEGAPKWPNTKLLSEVMRDYLLVKDHFLNGIRKVDAGVRLTSIHQYEGEGHFAKARLEVFQKQIEVTRAARGTTNMVSAWYGASAKVVESILVHGFGLLGRVPLTDLYGIGVYLSPFGLPHLSAKLADSDDNGVKHLILCRVILGNVEKVKAGSKQWHPSSVDFDTGSDDPKNPKWYVVWSTNANIRILPEFVVSFIPSGNMQGQPGQLIAVGALFSKLNRSLPPAKLQEISISFNAYKAGMMTKKDFSRKLQLVAGEKALKCAIEEINASE